MSEVESRILEKWIAANRDADIYIDCHSMVGGTAQTTFYTYASDHKIKAKLLEAQSIIKRHYEEQGYHPTKEMVRVVKNGEEYPKIPYFLNEYGIPSVMIEQHPGDLTHGGLPLHNDGADIENHVGMLSLYSYYGISTPNYWFLISDFRNYALILIGILLTGILVFLILRKSRTRS